MVMALRAAILPQHGAKLGKALHRTGASRADQQPVHLEQAQRRGVQEQVDRLRIGEAAFLGEGQWIDAKQRPAIS